MTRFLRLFSEFRQLEAMNASLFEKIDTLTDQRTLLLSQLSEVTVKLDDARKSEIESLRKVADHQARKHGAGIFDLASEIPVRPEAYEPIPRGKPQGSDLADQMEREFQEAQKSAFERAYERIRATAY